MKIRLGTGNTKRFSLCLLFSTYFSNFSIGCVKFYRGGSYCKHVYDRICTVSSRCWRTKWIDSIRMNFLRPMLYNLHIRVCVSIFRSTIMLYLKSFGHNQCVTTVLAIKFLLVSIEWKFEKYGWSSQI